jgi:hypothetical protein
MQQLVLDPNKANGSQLDALIQSFQLQAGFNQLSGVQNSVAARMAVANLGYQSALAQQQQSIMEQSITAQQALISPEFMRSGRPNQISKGSRRHVFERSKPEIPIITAQFERNDTADHVPTAKEQ